MSQLGFGFIEVGTVTPRPQPGNPKPRIFRLPEAEAIINRMGFNNHGVDALLARVEAARFKGVLGINIGKNFDTPSSAPMRIICSAGQGLPPRQLRHRERQFAQYRPAQPAVRRLAQQLLDALRLRREDLEIMHGKRVPLAIKIAPDMTDEETALVGRPCSAGMDAIIATTTSAAKASPAWRMPMRQVACPARRYGTRAPIR